MKRRDKLWQATIIFLQSPNSIRGETAQGVIPTHPALGLLFGQGAEWEIQTENHHKEWKI